MPVSSFTSLTNDSSGVSLKSICPPGNPSLFLTFCEVYLAVEYFTTRILVLVWFKMMPFWAMRRRV